MSEKAVILVVDDEDDVSQLIRQRFRRAIRDGQYEFLFAANGLEALSVLQERSDVALLFSDINMPKMDGLTLLGQVGQRFPLLKTVIISAYGDMSNIRTAMNNGAFDFICKPFDFEDFERTLQRSLGAARQVQDTVQAIQENNILKMYVNAGVLRFMCCKEYQESLLANETVEASILFVDISGFTAISEREPPDQVVHLLNACFDTIVRAVIDAGGYVDKFMGDAVLAVFRGTDHLVRAVHGALSVNTAMACVQAALSNGTTFSPKVSMGIHTGEVISGNVGSEALRRFDFTVIGDVVNTAQRLQSAAKAGQLLVTQATFSQLNNAFKGHPMGAMTLKNKQHPVEVVAVLEEML